MSEQLMQPSKTNQFYTEKLWNFSLNLGFDYEKIPELKHGDVLTVCHHIKKMYDRFVNLHTKNNFYADYDVIQRDFCFSSGLQRKFLPDVLRIGRISCEVKELVRMVNAENDTDNLIYIGKGNTSANQEKKFKECYSTEKKEDDKKITLDNRKVYYIIEPAEGCGPFTIDEAMRIAEGLGYVGDRLIVEAVFEVHTELKVTCKKVKGDD